MSSFIVIAPSDFERVDIDGFVGPIGWTVSDLRQLEENQQYSALNEWLHNAGTLDTERNVVEIKLVEDRELYVKYE